MYDIPIDSEITFTENGGPVYKNMELIKNYWYLKKHIYRIITHFRYYSDFLYGTVFAITDETMRVNKGKVMLVCYTYFYKFALLKYLDDTYNKNQNILGIFVEVGNNKLVTTRIKYKNGEQEFKVENYDEYKLLYNGKEEERE